MRWAGRDFKDYLIPLPLAGKSGSLHINDVIWIIIKI